MLRHPTATTILSAVLVLAVPPSGGATARSLDDPIEVSIAELTSLEWQPGDELPEEIAELDGETITIDGYMALGTLEGTQRFELVPEPCECGRSKVQHFVDVTLTEGTVSYRPGRITLTGTFEASEVEEDGFVVSLFRLEIESLE